MYRVFLIIFIIIVLSSCSPMKNYETCNEKHITENNVKLNNNNELETTDKQDIEQSNIEQKSSETEMKDNVNELTIYIADTHINLNIELEYDDLLKFKDEELSIIRNAYYAKHGYIFKTQKYSDYFLSYEWYKPSHEDVEKFLSLEDRLSINLVTKLEQRWRNLYNELSEEEITMIGMWQLGSPGLAAGYNALYYFNDDRSFTYNASQGDGESRLKSVSGVWYILNNKLYLYVKNESVLVGGELVPATGSFSTDYQIVGGELVNIQIEEPYLINYVLDFNQEHLEYKEDCSGAIIGNEEYYNLKTRKF